MSERGEDNVVTDVSQAPVDMESKVDEGTTGVSEGPTPSRGDDEDTDDSTIEIKEKPTEDTEEPKATSDDSKGVDDKDRDDDITEVKKKPTEDAEEPKATSDDSKGAGDTVAPPAAPEGTSVILTAATEYACYSPSSKQQCWAVASLKAPKYEPSSRSSVDLVAVIDRSGSMSGEKIKLVRKTLEFVVEQLKETDRISLVVYDTNVELVFGLMKMTAQNRERARSYVSSISTGSSTNLCGGLLRGMEQVALTDGGEKAQVQSVLLLTDGLANHGITDKMGIIEQMKKMQNEGLGAVSMSSAGPDIPRGRRAPRKGPAPQKSGGGGSGFFASLFGWGKAPEPEPEPEQETPETSVDVPLSKKEYNSKKFDGTVYTFGFGTNHDADMLEGISTQGGGVYYYIDSYEKIPESFGDCLGGLLSVMGQNMSVKLQAQGDTTFNKVHTSKNINWTKKNKSCEVALGDIQSEEGRDLVLELELPPVSSGTASENMSLVSVELSYFNVITSQFDTVECQVTTNRTDGDRGEGNMTVDIQRNRVSAAAALKEAEQLASQNNLSEAQECLKKAVAQLEESLSKENDLVKLLIVDLKKSMDAMKNRETFMSYGKNYVRSKQQSHSVQRTNYVEDFDDDVVSSGYMNTSRMAYRAEASSKKSGWF